MTSHPKNSTSVTFPESRMRTLKKVGLFCHNFRMRKITVIVLVTLFSLGSITPSFAWEIESKTDDFGSRVAYASTYFMPGIGNTDSFDTAYDNGAYNRLIIRCQDKTLEIFMTDSENLFSSGSALVRFGSGSPKKWSTSLSTDKEAFFFSSPKTLAASLAKISKFYVRASGASGYITANFNTGGLANQRALFKRTGCTF